MITSYDILKTILRTERGTSLEPMRKYIFEVAIRSTKEEIRKAVEEIYKVQVTSVRTGIMPGKLKRVRHQLGRTPNWKKAVVTLKDGHKIDLA